MSKPNFTSNNDSLPSIPKSKPLPQDSRIHKNTSTTDADFMLEENSELEGINDFLHENKHSHFNESLFEQELNKSGKLQVAHLLNIIDGSGDRPRSKPPTKAEKAPEASNFSQKSRAKSPITVTEHISQNVDSLSSNYSSVKVDDESIPKITRGKQATPLKTEEKQQVSKVKICPARIPSNIKDQAFTSTNIEKSKKNPEKLSQNKSPLKTKTPVATIEENKNLGNKNTVSTVPNSSRLKQRPDNKSPERLLQLKSAGGPSEEEEGTNKSPQINPQNDRICDTPTFTEKKQENKNWESVKSTAQKEEIHTEPAVVTDSDKELEKIEMLNEILAKREVQLELDDENILIKVPTQTDFSPVSRLSGSRTTRSPSKEISKYVSKLKKSGILPRDSLSKEKQLVSAKRTTSPGRNSSDVKDITTPAKTLSGYEQAAAGGLKIETPRRTIPDQRLKSPRKPIRQNVVEPQKEEKNTLKNIASVETTSSVKATPTKTIPTESKKSNEKRSHKSSFSRDTPSSLQEEIKTETSPSSSAAGQKTSELLQEVIKIIKELDTHYLVDLKTFLETNSVLILKDINSRIKDGTLDLQKKRELEQRLESQPSQKLLSTYLKIENENKKKVEDTKAASIKISFDDFGDFFEVPSTTTQKENIEKKIETHYMMTGNLNRVKDIETALSSFSHLSVGQLKDKILHLNSDILTSKTCPQLLSICPNQEEINLFRTYKGPISELNKANQYLYSMSGIPRLSARLEMTIFKMNFHQEIEKELKDMTRVRKILEFLHENHNLRNLLQIISNFKKEKFFPKDDESAKNPFTQCQSIINFAKINSKKSKDSLLTYLLKKISQQDSHFLDFANLNQDLGQAFDIRFELSIWNIEKIKSKFNQLELELELSGESNPPDSPFIESFQDFYQTSSPIISGAIQLGKATKSFSFQVVQLLGEELETTSNSTITEFLNVIKQVFAHVRDFKALKN